MYSTKLYPSWVLSFIDTHRCIRWIESLCYPTPNSPDLCMVDTCCGFAIHNMIAKKRGSNVDVRAESAAEASCFPDNSFIFGTASIRDQKLPTHRKAVVRCLAVSGRNDLVQWLVEPSSDLSREDRAERCSALTHSALPSSRSGFPNMVPTAPNGSQRLPTASPTLSGTLPHASWFSEATMNVHSENVPLKHDRELALNNLKA